MYFIKKLFSIAISCFVIVSNSNAELTSPSNIQLFRDVPTELKGIRESYNKKDFLNFYKDSYALASSFKKIDFDNLKSKDVNLQLWLSFYVVTAPVFIKDYDENTPLWDHDNIDIRTKLIILDYLNSLSDKVSNISKTYHIRNKSLSNLIASYSSTLVKALHVNYDCTLIEKHKKLRKEQEILNEKRRKETIEKYGLFTARDPRSYVYMNKLAFNETRNELLRSSLERSYIPNFIKMLVKFFPGQVNEVKKYLRIAGYTEEEITELIKKIDKNCS